MRIAVLTALMLAFAWNVSAQTARRVTVTTTQGDVIEGLLRGASETELTIEVGGQQLRLPLEGIAVVSFAGKVAAAEAQTSGASPMEEAYRAFQEIRSATEIGMLREQYSQKLLDTLPRVRAFTKSASGWTDVRLAMERAVFAYQAPLSDLSSWSAASTWWEIAGEYVAYAADLRKREGEEAHRESSDDREVRVGQSTEGRLGSGDRLVPKSLDESTEGAFADVLKFTVAGPSQLNVKVNCKGCTTLLQLTLADASGRRVEHRTSTLGRQLRPGTYYLWVHGRNGWVGEYQLTWNER